MARFTVAEDPAAKQLEILPGKPIDSDDSGCLKGEPEHD
jgi:hypothetical protein